MYIFDTSLSSSQNKKCFRQKLRENQNTHFMFNNFFLNIVSSMTQCEKIQ